MGTLEMRAAGPADAPELSRVHAESWRAAYPGMVPQGYLDELREDHWVEAFTDWLSTGRMKALMLLEDGRAVGASVYGPAREEALAGWGEVVTLYLLPEAFGRGLGGALLQSVLEDLRREGFSSAFLWALRENLRARRFYEKQGFAPTGDVLACEVGGETLTDLRYVFPAGRAAEFPKA